MTRKTEKYKCLYFLVKKKDRKYHVLITNFQTYALAKDRTSYFWDNEEILFVDIVGCHAKNETLSSAQKIC